MATLRAINMEVEFVSVCREKWFSQRAYAINTSEDHLFFQVDGVHRPNQCLHMPPSHWKILENLKGATSAKAKTPVHRCGFQFVEIVDGTSL